MLLLRVLLLMMLLLPVLLLLVLLLLQAPPLRDVSLPAIVRFIHLPIVCLPCIRWNCSSLPIVRK